MSGVCRHEGVPQRGSAYHLLYFPYLPGHHRFSCHHPARKKQCNLVWLENLNLRGGYKQVILDYIAQKHPDLVPLYDAIYRKKDRRYWAELDAQMRQFCEEEGLLYVWDDDSFKRPFHDPPIVVNYFFHEEIIPSAKENRNNTLKRIEHQHISDFPA